MAGELDLGIVVGEADLAGVFRQLDGIVRDVQKAVVVPALNRTAEQGAASIRRRVASIIGLPQTRLKKLVKPIKANYQTLRAAVRILNVNTPLHKTDAKAPPQSGSYPLKKVGPPVPLPNKGFRPTARRKLKGEAARPKALSGFFVRAGAKRLPIKKIYAPSPRRVFETAPGVAREELANLETTLRKNLQSQVDRRLAGK